MTDAQKVYCRVCGLYLGSTLETDFPVQITCPICEESSAYVKVHVGGMILSNAEEPWYPNDEYMTWLGDVFSRSHEDAEARCLIRLLMEHREGDFYEFANLNGAQK